MRKTAKLLTFAAALAFMASPLPAQDFDTGLQRVLNEQVPSIAAADVVVAAVRAQNEMTGAYDQAKIDELDQAWRAEAEAGAGAMIDEVFGRPCSVYLQDQKAASGGLLTEIIVMDAKGLNVGQSDVTSDYWQGDEAKWQETYPKGAGATFIDEIEFDESTGQFQAQVSATVVDPATNAPIGAITVGVNLENL